MDLKGNSYKKVDCQDSFDYIKNLLKSDVCYPNQTTKIKFRDTAAFKPPEDGILSYDKHKTLLGVWFDERSDVRFLRNGESIPGRYTHHYNTTYGANFNCKPVYRMPEGLKNFDSYPTKRPGLAYPSHQPELDPPNPEYYHWRTTYLNDYIRHPYSKRVCVPVESGDEFAHYK